MRVVKVASISCARCLGNYLDYLYTLHSEPSREETERYKNYLKELAEKIEGVADCLKFWVGPALPAPDEEYEKFLREESIETIFSVPLIASESVRVSYPFKDLAERLSLPGGKITWEQVRELKRITVEIVKEAIRRLKEKPSCTTKPAEITEERFKRIGRMPIVLIGCADYALLLEQVIMEPLRKAFYYPFHPSFWEDLREFRDWLSKFRCYHFTIVYYKEVDLGEKIKPLAEEVAATTDIEALNLNKLHWKIRKILASSDDEARKKYERTVPLEMFPSRYNFSSFEVEGGYAWTKEEAEIVRKAKWLPFLEEEYVYGEA